FFKYDEQKNTFYKFAHYDKFISLPNSVLFNEILNKSISHAKRHDKILAILLVNVIPKNADKHLNEPMAKELGQFFGKVLRNEDVISMLNHNQFIVLLSDIKKPKFASVAAKKLLKICENDIEIHHQKTPLNAHVGICIYPNDGVSLEQLIENTYQALISAQNNKDNSHYHFYSERLDAEAHEYMSIEADLKNSIDHKELTLYYQPILDLKSGKIVAVEALVRWIHPKLGMLYPDKFIPMAEDSGFIVKLGEWALLLACLTNKHWQDNGYQPVKVAMNISVKQFYHSNIITMLKNALRATGLNPIYLELEITESTIMLDPVKAKEILLEIKEIGVQIAIDHFGAGYTSINHFKELPIGSVKIDQNYIKNIPHNAIDTSLVGAMISLGHSLGIKVVAEGVETVEQLQYLSSQNCDIAQGYFLSYPVSANSISEQFKKAPEKAIV
ncbi:MAG TPA: GGDEF domain-containing phosphodiesterase, partial [Gammaproteobacteria bacterium]|nr:GGDEF domain-containing phosphodiesterase [Gammaproteobacteria bacterium]